jgi:ABC-type glycerol-3-phosphate transport system permease component
MTSPLAPESRTYRHTKCGAETVVSGDALSVVSNPLADMTRTWCTPCNAFFPVSEYVWADTDEKIVDYYARHSTKATAVDRFLCSKVFLILSVILGAIVGIVVGFVLARNAGWGQRLLVAGFLAFLGVFAAAALNVSVISKVIVKRVCGVADTRALK